jgi:hypothetical protein
VAVNTAKGFIEEGCSRVIDVDAGFPSMLEARDRFDTLPALV